MYKKPEWTKDQIQKLGYVLQFEKDAPPKPKKERYLDEETGKYKFREKKIEKIKCPECGELFFQKRPRQEYCQDFCRIVNWQTTHRKELKMEKLDRIEKMWG